MAPVEQVLEKLAQDNAPAQRLAQAERRIKNLEAELLEYVRVEAVLVAARKVDADTITKAHELVRSSS